MMATLLPMQVPFPTFTNARSRLLGEISLTDRKHAKASVALTIEHGPGTPSSDH